MSLVVCRANRKEGDVLSDREMDGERHKDCESDEIENSDESDRPSGERWAPVGANDGDNEFVADEYKYVNAVEKYVRFITFSLSLSLFFCLHFFVYKSVNSLSIQLHYLLNDVYMISIYI